MVKYANINVDNFPLRLMSKINISNKMIEIIVWIRMYVLKHAHTQTETHTRIRTYTHAHINM